MVFKYAPKITPKGSGVTKEQPKAQVPPTGPKRRGRPPNAMKGLEADLTRLAKGHKMEKTRDHGTSAEFRCAKCGAVAGVAQVPPPGAQKVSGPAVDAECPC